MRHKQLFDFGWKFHRGEVRGAESPGYDDKAWRQVDLPHDWSIEDIPVGGRQPFLKFQTGKWKFHKGDSLAWRKPDFDDRRWQEIKAPAEWAESKKEAWGWYRRELKVPAELMGKNFILDMGLIGEVNEVFLNGRSLGRAG